MDKSVSKKELKVFGRHVIKYKLNTVLKNSDDISRINSIVDTFNIMTFGAYNLANFHILRVLKNNKLVPELDQTFFNHICNYVSKSKGKFKDPLPPNSEPTKSQKDKKNFDPVKFKIQYQYKLQCYQDLKESALKFRENLPSDFVYPDRDMLGSIQNFLTDQMSTATKNHLGLNFESRFKTFLNKVYNVGDYYQCGYIFRSVFKCNIKKKSKFDKDPRTQIVINALRILLKHLTGLKDIESPKFVLPFYLKILKYFEAMKIKSFSLLPQKNSLIPSHITIANSCLPDIFSLWSGEFKKVFKEMEPEKLWSRTFKIPGETGRKWFANMITTNSYDVSVHYKSPPRNFKYSKEVWTEMDYPEKIEVLNKILKARKKEKEIRDKTIRDKIIKNKINNGDEEISEENKEMRDKDHEPSDFDSKAYYDIAEYHRFLSNDPGHRSLFTMLDSDNGEIIRCTAKEFKHRTGQTKRDNSINRRKDKINILKEFSDHSLKTSCCEVFLENLKIRMSKYSEIREEYKRTFYRKLNFSGRIKRQKTYYLLAKRLEKKGKKTLIGWGTGGTNQKGIKGNHMPNKGFCNHVKRTTDLDTKATNEYNTTAMCSVCYSKTGKKMKYWKNIDQDGSECLKLLEIYGLRRCTNNECRITWDRDVNACINIMIVLLSYLLGLERPKYLCISKKLKAETSR